MRPKIPAGNQLFELTLSVTAWPAIPIRAAWPGKSCSAPGRGMLARLDAARTALAALAAALACPELPAVAAHEFLSR
jgi:hypothetical protein